MALRNLNINLQEQEIYKKLIILLKNTLYCFFIVHKNFTKL